jgi:hypothetical protein
MSKWCVIQPGRHVHQLGTVPTFAQRWVADTSISCLLLLLIYHWRWIWWRGNPMFDAVIWKGLILIIQKWKNLWFSHLRAINPLEETASTLLLQN